MGLRSEEAVLARESYITACVSAQYTPLAFLLRSCSFYLPPSLPLSAISYSPNTTSTPLSLISRAEVEVAESIYSISMQAWLEGGNMSTDVARQVLKEQGMFRLIIMATELFPVTYHLNSIGNTK